MKQLHALDKLPVLLVEYLFLETGGQLLQQRLFILFLEQLHVVVDQELSDFNEQLFIERRLLRELLKCLEFGLITI